MSTWFPGIAMTLMSIAAAISSGPPQDDVEAALRACFSNILTGLNNRHLTLAAATRRLSEMISAFGAYPVKDRAALRLAHLEALKKFGEEDHYMRPGPLTEHLGQPGVTIQASEDGALGQFWLGRRTPARRIASAFASGACAGTVGAPGQPLWFTPYIGEIRDLCEEARDPALGRSRRAAIARRAVALLGLSHIHAKDEVIAMVTGKPIGELGFDHPITGEPWQPAGSTAIEARGHRRFRPWPSHAHSDRYGRTYDLKGKKRASTLPVGLYGASEGIRPTLGISNFAHCIFVGPLSDAHFDDRDDDYLKEISATQTSVDLLTQLAGITGL